MFSIFERSFLCFLLFCRSNTVTCVLTYFALDAEYMMDAVFYRLSRLVIAHAST